MKLNKRLKAICFMILASIFFTTMNLLSKLASDITIYQKAFISNCVALIIISSLIMIKKISFIGKRENRKRLFIRGLCGTLSLAAGYFTLDHMILSDATMISKLSPSFAIVFGYFLLKDTISKRQLLFLIITLVGAVLIIKPSLSLDIIPALVGLFGAAFAGIAFTMIRSIGNSEDNFTIIFYNVFFSSFLSFPFIFLKLKNLSNTSGIIYMILAGLCIAFGQICLTLAYKNTPASSVAMYDYVGLIVSAIYGFIIFDEIPDWLSIIGYVIIFCSALINFFLSQRDLSNK